MNTDYFNPIQALIEGTGAVINSSKKRFTWRFELDSQEHSVELECSFITNKRRISFDGSPVFKGSKPMGRDFQHRFQHNKHIITIENHRTDANLLVDSMSFDEIYTKRIWSRSFDHKPSDPIKESDNDPRPARHISEEEYSTAARITGIESESKQKKSLHDILHTGSNKGKPRPKIAEDFLELEENKEKQVPLPVNSSKPIDLLGFEGTDIFGIQSSSPGRKKPQDRQNSDLLFDEKIDIFSGSSSHPSAPQPKYPTNTDFLIESPPHIYESSPNLLDSFDTAPVPAPAKHEAPASLFPSAFQAITPR